MSPSNEALNEISDVTTDVSPRFNPQPILTASTSSFLMSNSSTHEQFNPFNSLEETKELALFQLLLIRLQLLHQLIPLLLCAFFSIPRGLRLLGDISTLHFPLRRALKYQAYRGPSADPDGGKDASQAHSSGGPHLISEGGRAHSDDVSLLDEAGAGGVTLWCDRLNEDITAVVLVEDETKGTLELYKVVA